MYFIESTLEKVGVTSVSTITVSLGMLVKSRMFGLLKTGLVNKVGSSVYILKA